MVADVDNASVDNMLDDDTHVDGTCADNMYGQSSMLST
jgi:hypothetical protein